MSASEECGIFTVELGPECPRKLPAITAFPVPRSERERWEAAVDRADLAIDAVGADAIVQALMRRGVMIEQDRFGTEP